MARTARPRVAKARDPYTDGSVVQPNLDWAATSWASLRRDIGSTGLRQWGGYVREEFLPQLRGRELARTYREMLDNQAVIGAIVFAITQAMRSVRWRDIPANDTAEAQRMADFAHSLRMDLSTPWEDHITEALTMIGYGFASHEIVYKKRLGRRKESDPIPSSKYNDGMIGWRRLPLRGQDTILKWFFDQHGQITGLTQMPWVGRLIDIPVQKLMIFRPTVYKNNPEGRSVLRSSVRAHHFIKRLEEMEAILFERLSGLPVIYAPAELITAALSGASTPEAKAALASYTALQKMVTNVRIGEQMGLVLPSNLYPGQNGPSTQKQYQFELVTPSSGHVVDPGPIIGRYKLDILKTVLADFIDLGHQARGTQNLAITKIDMFYQGIEGWLTSMASVHNRYGLSRIWELNGLDDALMPSYMPDMASRMDLQQLGNFVFQLSRSGIDLTDPQIIDYLRTQAGMPNLTEDEIDEAEDRRELNDPALKPLHPLAPALRQPANDGNGGSNGNDSGNDSGKGDDEASPAAKNAADAMLRTMIRGALREHKKAARPIAIGATPLKTPPATSADVLPNGHDSP
jgi:hypothetical protein